MPKDCKDCKLCLINHFLVLKCGLPKPMIKPKQQNKPAYEDIKMEDTARPINRTLRIITIVSWIPAFAFLLSHGIISDGLFPVLGLIPMTFSTCFGIISLMGWPKLRIASTLVDLFIAVFLIGMLIPSWIMMADGYYSRWGYGRSGTTMLGTYGTVMMMANFCIHSWIVLRAIPYSIIFSTKSSVCPHCNGDLRQRAPPAMARTGSQHSHGSYHFVQQDDPRDTEEARRRGPEKDARPSFQDEEASDETAPLM